MTEPKHFPESHVELRDILEALLTSCSREFIYAQEDGVSIRERVRIKRAWSQIKAARNGFKDGSMLFGEAQAWATTVTEALRVTAAERTARATVEIMKEREGL